MAAKTMHQSKARLHTVADFDRSRDRAAIVSFRERTPQAANDGEAACLAEAELDTGRATRIGDNRADEQLVQLAQEGQTQAFDLLFRKYQYKTIQLVGRMVGEADAPDVAQEAFIKAYRALPGFRGQSAFYTWLYRIAVNTAKNHLVSRARRPTNQDIDVADAEQFGHTERLSDVSTPESNLLAEEIRDELTVAIQALPSDLRQAIVLRELEGLSYEEIAEAMDCPIGTVRSRIFRARESIDAVVQPLLSA